MRARMHAALAVSPTKQAASAEGRFARSKTVSHPKNASRTSTLRPPPNNSATCKSRKGRNPNRESSHGGRNSKTARQPSVIIFATPTKKTRVSAAPTMQVTARAIGPKRDCKMKTLDSKNGVAAAKKPGPTTNAAIGAGIAECRNEGMLEASANVSAAAKRATETTTKRISGR